MRQPAIGASGDRGRETGRKQPEVQSRSLLDHSWVRRQLGVVTALEYQLHSVDQVLSGALTYPFGRVPDLLQALVKFLAGFPDEMDARLPSCCHPNTAEDSKSMCAIAATREWEMTCSDRYALASAG